MTKRYRVLMVCLGNICRSPTAEAVLRAKLDAARLAALVEVDSAGTGSWHVGEPPDGRSQAHARRRGYELSGLRARTLVREDFQRFDLLLAMDEDNLAELEAMRPRASPTELELLMAYSPRPLGRVVPDPYSGDASAFERVLDLVEPACDGLVDRLVLRLLGGPRS